MTNQTDIQNLAAIRWGSAKVEIKNDSNQWINLGACKSITATTSSSGIQKFEPDNAPPIVIDPVPDTWDWSFEMQEAWNATALQLLRGEIDTWSHANSQTTVGVYAGTGKRPRRQMRFTNTTAGQPDTVITLSSCVLTSELDWNFPTDKDGTTALALTVKISAERQISGGFGTLVIPDGAAAHTISPASVAIAPAGTQQLTVSGSPDTVTYGTMNSAVATVSGTGLVTGVAAGITQVIVTIDGTVKMVTVTVSS